MTRQTVEPATKDLLALLSSGALSTKDARVNPLLVIDLMDDGLVNVSTVDATITITEKGLGRLSAHQGT